MTPRKLFSEDSRDGSFPRGVAMGEEPLVHFRSRSPLAAPVQSVVASSPESASSGAHFACSVRVLSTRRMPVATVGECTDSE